jgi:hypothetical protein
MTSSMVFTVSPLLKVGIIGFFVLGLGMVGSPCHGFPSVFNLISCNAS